jgi:hypothetical protein
LIDTFKRKEKREECRERGACPVRSGLLRRNEENDTTLLMGTGMCRKNRRIEYNLNKRIKIQ